MSGKKGMRWYKGEPSPTHHRMLEAYHEHKGNFKKAAESMGLHPSQLERDLSKHFGCKGTGHLHRQLKPNPEFARLYKEHGNISAISRLTGADRNHIRKVLVKFHNYTPKRRAK